MLKKIPLSAALLTVMFTTGAVNAATINFTSMPTLVINNGGGLFKDTGLSGLFTGSFSFPDTTDDADTLEFDEADYELTGSAHLSNGTQAIAATQLNVNIQNNHELDQEEIDVATMIFGSQLPLGFAVGSPVDVWTVGATEDDAFFNNDDDLVNGHNFEVALVDLDATVFDNLDYQSAPDLSQFELAVFAVIEGDASGDPLYLAAGPATIIGSPSAVPLPAAFPLFVSALAGLGFLTQRRRKKCY